jgi:hypothetical protein
MQAITAIGLDIAKSVFQVHGIDAQGKVMVRRQLKRRFVIMASGLVCRTNRPNTWLHRPAGKREETPCQLGAVHTWHISAVLTAPGNVGYRG